MACQPGEAGWVWAAEHRPTCSNYRPVTQMDRMLTYFGVELQPGDSTAPDVWPLGLAPFIRLAHEGSGNREALVGHFGLVPVFAKELAFGKKTYNARSETVARLPSFRDAWRRSQRCIVPAEAVYEPSRWETGRAVRWRIECTGGMPAGDRRHVRELARPRGASSGPTRSPASCGDCAASSTGTASSPTLSRSRSIDCAAARIPVGVTREWVAPQAPPPKMR